MAYRLGVDVGGTFTDLFLVSEGNGGAQFRVKTPSTPRDPSEGVLTGVRRICDEAGHRRRRAAEHPARHDRRDERGARVERRARRADHDDRGSARSSIWPARRRRARWRAGSSWSSPIRRLRSRTRARRSSGSTPAATSSSRSTRRRSRRSSAISSSPGIESLTVALINSYVNPAHEEQIGAIVERLYPGFPVTLSAQVLPEFREYERALTACMNSYVRPKVADYVDRLQSELQSIGAKADVNILRSDAGLMTTREAAAKPDLRGAVGAVRRCRRRTLRRRARPASTTSSRSTWAGRRPTSRSARTASRRSGARRRSRTSASGSRRSTSTRSARAAARSPTCPS